MTKLEIYWSFRSPYSYLAVDRLCDVAEQYDVEIDFRPVRPLALREPDFFTRGRKQFLPYLFRDVPREAERLGISFGMPSPDPIVMDLNSGKVADEQPYMDRIMPLGLAASAMGRGLEFAQVVSRRVWGGAANWHEDENLAAAATEAGVMLTELDAYVSEHAEQLQADLEHNEAAQLKLHWGVPLMVLDGEPFFGQDRLDSLLWRLDQKGLKKA